LTKELEENKKHKNQWIPSNPDIFVTLVPLGKGIPESETQLVRAYFPEPK
jgi:hypothetical protein